MSMFRSGKVLKVEFRAPRGAWASGMDFHKALRSRLRSQAVEVLLPRPDGEPDEGLRGIPELRWVGGGAHHQWFLPGRNPFAAPPEEGRVVEAGRWLALYLHGWVRQTPPPSLVRSIALARVPVTTSRPDVQQVREERTALEDAIREELSAMAWPTLQRCAVGIRDDGLIALAGPGELRDEAMRRLREELAAVRGLKPAEIWYSPMLEKLSPEGGEDFLTELISLVEEREDRDEDDGLDTVVGGQRLVATRGAARVVWDVQTGASVRLVVDGDDSPGSLTASGSLASQIVDDWSRLRAEGSSSELARTDARRLALRVRRLSSDQVLLLVVSDGGLLVQVAEEGLASTSRRASSGELSADALIELDVALQATKLVRGMRQALMRQQRLAPEQSDGWTWTAEYLSRSELQAMESAAVVETPLERAVRLQGEALRAGGEVRVTSVTISASKPEGSAPSPRVTLKPATSGEVWTREPAPAPAPTAASGLTAEAAERVGRAVARAEAPAPSRRGRCRSCNGVFDLDPDWRVHAHLVPGSRRSCEGSGCQVAPEPAEQAAAGGAA
jgi:hypothetical protein